MTQGCWISELASGEQRTPTSVPSHRCLCRLVLGSMGYCARDGGSGKSFRHP